MRDCWLRGLCLMTISKLKTPSLRLCIASMFTMRRGELKVALPGDQSHSWYQNAYDARAYKRLSTEFGVAPTTDWRQKLDHGCQGLGSWSTYMEPSSAYRHAHYSDGSFFHPLDAIHHNRDISGAWTMFIPDKSEGFTQAGVERLNDSIRTYVWAVLGAQVQTRSNILKAGTGFDAQKQFLANVEDAIASPADIPSSIARYQKTLQYASTPLDFVFGLGLYLALSDMTLHPGNVQGYNNDGFVEVLPDFKLKWTSAHTQKELGAFIKAREQPLVRFTLRGIQHEAEHRFLDISKIHVGPGLTSDEGSVVLGHLNLSDSDDVTP